MRMPFGWPRFLAPALLLVSAAVSLPPARASQLPSGNPPATWVKAAPTATLVGTIVAVVSESRTLVVDIPLGADVLRVGAAVTPQTKLEVNGDPAAFEDLEAGSRVRLTFRRIATGNEAVAVEVMRGPRR